MDVVGRDTFGVSLLGLPVACSSDGFVQAGAGAR